MEFVEELKKQLAYHEKQIGAIKTLLEGYSEILESSISNTSLNDSSSINNIKVNSPQNIGSELFPTSKTKKQQAVWLFKNVLQRATRMPEIQTVYEKYSGKNDDITMTVRLLKGSPLNGTIKRTYDQDSNNKTFWGLAEWYVNGDFLADFHPYN